MEAYLTITGYVGGAVEHVKTQNGISKASFRLACTPRIHRAGGWTDDPTTWMTVTCWRGLADHVTSSFGKGDPVIVVGRLRTRTWKNDDGTYGERRIIEATTAGHDLTRGTSTFHKIQRPDPQVAQEEEAREEAKLILAAESESTEGSTDDHTDSPADDTSARELAGVTAG